MGKANAFDAISLEGKVIVVTGAGSGIGLSTATLCASRGAKVVVADINEEAANDVTAAIHKDSGQARPFKVDVSREAEIAAMIDFAVAEFGAVDGAFNNAGIGSGGTLEDHEIERWDKLIAVNLTGVFLCMKYEVREMLKKGSGAIVNTGSIGSVVGLPNNTDYNAAKHGVLGLTRSAALDFGTRGLRVNAVLPGAIETPLMRENLDARPDLEQAMADSHPVGRYGQPHEVAEAAAWLLSDAASFITGVGLPVDGGYTTV